MLIAATHPFIQSLEHIAGFLIVLFALALLWCITAIIGKYFISREDKFVTDEPEPPASPGSMGSSDGPTDEELVAVSACVAALMGQRSRVVSIRRAGDWHREGRREHFASRKIR
jgi:hypothetical protein